MQNRPVRVLGISPGVRWTGIAAVQGDVLLRFDIITTRRYAGNIVPLRVRIERLLDDVEPDLVVIELPTFRRDNAPTHAIGDVIEGVLRARDIRYYPRPLTLARRHAASPLPPTRATVHHALAARFPQLAKSTRSRPGLRWWSDLDRYWERAFAALALAASATAVDSCAPETSMHRSSAAA